MPGRVEIGPRVQTDDLYRPAQTNSSATTALPTSGTLSAMAEESPIEPAPQSISNPRLRAGWRTSVVFLFILIPTTLAGFVDMWINREFTYWAGAVFVVTCLIAAIKVRPIDLWTAVISPPIAYLLALLIAGQITTFPGGGSLLIREASLLATGLAFNAPYIYGGTLIALVVVLIRRPKVRKLSQP